MFGVEDKLVYCVKVFHMQMTLSPSFVTVAGVRPACNVDSSQTEGGGLAEGILGVKQQHRERGQSDK